MPRIDRVGAFELPVILAREIGAEVHTVAESLEELEVGERRAEVPAARELVEEVGLRAQRVEGDRVPVRMREQLAAGVSRRTETRLRERGAPESIAGTLILHRARAVCGDAEAETA